MSTQQSYRPVSPTLLVPTQSTYVPVSPTLIQIPQSSYVPVSPTLLWNYEQEYMDKKSLYFWTGIVIRDMISSSVIDGTIYMDSFKKLELLNQSNTRNLLVTLINQIPQKISILFVDFMDFQHIMNVAVQNKDFMDLRLQIITMRNNSFIIFDDNHTGYAINDELIEYSLTDESLRDKTINFAVYVNKHWTLSITNDLVDLDGLNDAQDTDVLDLPTLDYVEPPRKKKKMSKPYCYYNDYYNKQ